MSNMSYSLGAWSRIQVGSAGPTLHLPIHLRHAVTVSAFSYYCKKGLVLLVEENFQSYHNLFFFSWHFLPEKLSAKLSRSKPALQSKKSTEQQEESNHLQAELSHLKSEKTEMIKDIKKSSLRNWRETGFPETSAAAKTTWNPQSNHFIEAFCILSILNMLQKINC